MRILVLGEGEARHFGSWSGISHKVVEALEVLGHQVVDVNCDLEGASRLLAAAATFSPKKRRWWVRYHLGEVPFRMRSRRARRGLRRHAGSIDVVLQFGATFHARMPAGVPLFLYCDGNIALSHVGAEGGASDAAELSDAEIATIKAREAKIYREAAHIFCFSRTLATSFADHFSIPESRLSTVYAGSNFDSSDIVPEIRRRRQSPPNILFVGRDFHRKGGDILLSAFRLVREHVPDARLTIIGPRDAPPPMEGVDFLGFLSRDDPEQARRLNDSFQSATVFCMPTRFEGLSIALLEAMLFALPCVSASTRWARPEMIVEGETGMTVPLDDPASLAAALRTLLQDRDYAEELGRKGRDRALEFFTWPTVVAKMEARMTAVLDSRVARGPHDPGSRP